MARDQNKESTNNTRLVEHSKYNKNNIFFMTIYIIKKQQSITFLELILFFRVFIEATNKMTIKSTPGMTKLYQLLKIMFVPYIYKRKENFPLP
jgi:hypothetical protein